MNIPDAADEKSYKTISAGKIIIIIIYSKLIIKINEQNKSKLVFMFFHSIFKQKSSNIKK